MLRVIWNTAYCLWYSISILLRLSFSVYLAESTEVCKFANSLPYSSFSVMVGFQLHLIAFFFSSVRMLSISVSAFEGPVTL